MRNQTLGQIKASLRSELRQSSNPAVAQSGDHILVAAIEAAVSMIHATHSWPHMRAREDVALEAGSYLYDWPAGMDYENVEKVSYKFNTIWLPVLLFTDDDETYNIFDTEAGVRSDPVLRYRIVNGDTQLEVWPIPASPGILRIKGLLRPPELSSDTVRVPFDDILVAKIAAAQCARSKDEREAKMAEATAYGKRLEGKSSTARNFSIAGSKRQPAGRGREYIVPPPPYVIIGS